MGSTTQPPASSEAVPTGILRTLIVLALLVSTALLFPLLLYVCNRQAPAIRYRNPKAMAAAALSSSVYSISRCAVSLNPSNFSCTRIALLFGFTLQTTLMSYFLAELIVVLTFNLTELMTRYNNQRILQRKAISRLQFLLRRRHVAIGWFTIQALWNLPMYVVVFTGDDYSTYDGTNCPIELRNKVVPLNMIQYCLIGLATISLSSSLSKVVDNFGIRKAFHDCARAMCVVLLAYLPVSILYEDAFVISSRIELFIAVVGAQIITVFHIVGPVRQAFAEGPTARTTFKGTVGILEAFLNTQDGFAAFSEFAKGEYEIEVVSAWRALVDFRGEAKDALSASEIFETYIGPEAPLPLRRFVSPGLLHRYEMAFTGNQKYGINPDTIHDTDSFNLLLDELLSYMVHTSLPRFQTHAIGQTHWRPFVEQFQTRMTLDMVLDKQESDAKPTPITKFAVGQRKPRLETIQSMGNFGSMMTELSGGELSRKPSIHPIERANTLPQPHGTPLPPIVTPHGPPRIFAGEDKGSASRIQR
ncbi:hypothetical protein ACHHYP_12527 [Achlya hypogyna]|uniref:RGS domain-containing protein n=1 Tax=Achlya hypogyna TaxID=1202772 RepID=A0A1V9YGU5_ACHHY|nr:hypothetical protein ACHHYP_12527 [Achlya hypogyna]